MSHQGTRAAMMKLKNFGMLALLAVSACGGPSVSDAGVVDEIDAGLDDAGRDAGRPPPGPLSWRKVVEAPPSRSNQVAFYWPAAQATFFISGNHNTGPLQDAWSWNGSTWAQVALPEVDYPARKNAGVAVDVAGGKVFVFGGVWSGYPRDGGAYTVTTKDDFRQFDGTRWTEVVTATRPSSRSGAAMAWDGVSNQVLLFGGSDNVNVFSDTWVFTNGEWAQRATGTAAHPSARLNTRMAFDPIRRRVVLFGGQDMGPDDAINLQDTWEWDGTTWREIAVTGAVPSGRGHHAMVFDPIRQRVMLLGGCRNFSPIPKGSSLADQWEWDGAQWTQVTPTGPRPGKRTAPSLSFDPGRNVVVLHGGFDDLDLSDTWEWNGQAWVERSLLPVPRSEFAFGQAGPRGEALLFGGYIAAGGVELGDTYRFVGERWQRVHTDGPTPPARSGASLAYLDDVAVLYGGRSGQTLLSDMWTLERGQTRWRQRTDVAVPAGRRQAAMGTDPIRKRIILFGGRNATALLDATWSWDGTDWTRLNPAQSPPARIDATLSFDPVRSELVLSGGVGANGTVLNDMWSFDGATWKRREGRASAPASRISPTQAFDSWGRFLSWGGREGQVPKDGVSVDDGTGWIAQPGDGPGARFGARWIDLGDRWVTVFGSTSNFTNSWEDFADAWELAPR